MRQLQPLFTTYFVTNAILCPIKLAITLYIWRLALRYIQYFDNLDQRKCRLVINSVQLFSVLVFSLDVAISFCQFLNIFVSYSITWYDSLYNVTPFLRASMYLVQALLLLSVMRVLNNIAHEAEAAAFTEPVDTMIQNADLLEPGHDDLPFDTTIDQSFPLYANSARQGTPGNSSNLRRSRFNLLR